MNLAILPQPTATPNPIQMLPAELIPQAAKFFAFWSETLKGSVSLAVQIRYWMEEKGLSSAEIWAAMRQTMEPEVVAVTDTAPKVIAALGRGIVSILRERDRAAAAAQRKTLTEEERATTLRPEEFDTVKQRLRDKAAAFDGKGGAL